MAEIGDSNQLNPLSPVAPPKKVGPRKEQEETPKKREKHGRKNQPQSEQPTDQSDSDSRKNRIDDYA